MKKYLVRGWEEDKFLMWDGKLRIIFKIKGEPKGGRFYGEVGGENGLRKTHPDMFKQFTKQIYSMIANF